MKNPIRAIIVGHSYLATENRKNLKSIGDLGAMIRVLSPNKFNGMIFNYEIGSDEIAGKGYSIVPLRTFKIWFAPQAAYIFRSFDLGIRRFNPDVIHIECDPFSPVFAQVVFVARIVARQARIVCTVKQNTYTSRGKLYDSTKDFVATRLIPHVDRFITVNRGVEDIYHSRYGVRRDRMERVTQLGIDVSLFCPPSPEKKRDSRKSFGLCQSKCIVGYAGRLVRYKGVFDLVDAVRAVRSNRCLDLDLALLGDGPARKELEQISVNSPWLHVLGRVPHEEVARFMQSLDVFVMPPHILKDHVEHDAHALLEAMAVGVPCIGTPSGAISDILNGVGVIVAPENVNELSVAIGALLEKTDCDEMCRSARDRVIEQFSLEAVAKSYYSVYQNVLSAGQDG